MDDKTVQTFPFTDPTRVSFLKRVSIEGQINDIHPEVKVYMEANQIQVVGSRNSVRDTETVIEKILAETDLYGITVSDPSRMRLLQTDVTRRYIGSKLLQKGLQAVYHTCNDKINVRCKHGEFDQVRGVLDSAIVSEDVDAREIGVTLRGRLESFRDCTEVDDNQKCIRISVHVDKYQQVMEIVDTVKQSRKEGSADGGLGGQGERRQDNGGTGQDSSIAHGDEAVLYRKMTGLKKPGIENIMRSDRFQAFLKEAAHGQTTKVAPCHVSEEQGNIFIKEGKLEDIGFKVDVIVCAASRTLDLSKGVVVRALSEAAGPDFRKRCEDKIKIEEMKKNSMTVVPPYHLKCNHVLFVCLPHWDKKQETIIKEKYQSLLSECLERISGMEPIPSSIALPALGCGKTGFPRDLVADLMMDTLKQYIRTHQVDIYLIVPPDTHDIRQTFQARREVFHIGDIRLTVRRGDILQEEGADAIVHSVSQDRSLTGSLSTKLVERFGERFQADFAKTSSALQRSGLSFCTTCGPWSCIVHLCSSVFKGKDGTCWVEAVLSCLSTTWEKFKPASLAFPCFGVGPRLSPDQMTEFLYDAIQQYHAGYYRKNHIKDIRLIVLHEGEFDRIVQTLNGIQKRESKRREVVGQEQAYDLCVTSTDQSRAQNLVEEIQKFVSANARSEVVVDNSLVPALSGDKLDELQDLAQNHSVGVKIIGSKLLLYGMAEDTEGARHDVSMFLRTCHSARWSSGERKTDDHLETEAISGYVEDAYQHKRTYTLFKSQSDKAYRLKVKDGKVMIRLLPDRRETRLLPDGRDTCLYRRMSITYDDIPSTWTPQEHDVVDTVPVEGEELEKVISLFQAKRRSKSEMIDIKMVHRIQNRLLHKKYKAEVERLSIQNGWDKVNERTLWHGTNEEAVEQINRNGFDRSYCGKNNTKFGEGTYFSVDPSYSSRNTYSPPDSSGLKYVYQAKVLTGYPVEGYPSMKYLPLRQGNIPYDSAVNNVKAIDAYVIFKDDQAYPEYLIIFTDGTSRQVDTSAGKTAAGSCDEQDKDSSTMVSEL